MDRRPIATSSFISTRQNCCGLDRGIFNLIPRRHYLIGYWTWELPVFPAIWASALNCVHEIWTPSQFGADHYKDLVQKPVRVIPHAVPVNDISQKDARQRLGLPIDRFIFLMVFDTDSYPMRKNPDGVVRAFTDAFPNRTDSSPILVIKMQGQGNRSQALYELLREARHNSSIVVIDEVFHETQIRHLQAACDCYVSLHRSEGFGLNIAECMAAGKLAIVTNFSGSTDFTTAQNSILIPYTMRAVQSDEYYFGRGQWWAEPQITKPLSTQCAGPSQIRNRPSGWRNRPKPTWR